MRCVVDVGELDAFRVSLRLAADAPQLFGALTRGLEAEIGPGLVCAGQAGAGTAGRPSAATLQTRLRQHARGNMRGSPWRRSLAAALPPELHLVREGTVLLGEGERLMSAGIETHLSVVVAPTGSAGLRQLEQSVLAALDPALNLHHVGASPLCRRLRALRRGPDLGS